MAIINVEDIAYVRFAASDLDKMRAFLEDFGFTCATAGDRLFAKGSDGQPFLHTTELGDPAFKGLGLRAESVEDLEKIAAHDGAEIEDLDAPGGGKVVRLTDPDGFMVDVVAGQAVIAGEFDHADRPRNSAANRARLGDTVRLDAGPSHVRRIGHCVLRVSDFRKSEAWYKDRFGFLTSDEIEAARNVPLGAFMRCNRGEKPTDHHTLFLAQMPGKPGFMHAAFEVANLDDLMLGHTHLKAKGRDQAWGVGRHILGSQIFDYWNDPWGNELEHWTDGDLFTADSPPNKATVSDLLAVQWGPEFPALTGKLAPPASLLTFVLALHLRVRNLFRRQPQ